ncbi:peptidoglycan-binding protein [Microbacterium sp. H1-D42]|uniref:peptidoglycan-binding protein n=1 Tax=Microbacterium sp. H1-D42 TaxID=2925844 RepID=UPI001F537688|nr:peptidoglycan-binding protein [Microbacterium sp. H1-D42]UNK69562.1 peptidoglycan-binding protein [Microbacterium sp. H1-D42]
MTDTTVGSPGPRRRRVIWLTGGAVLLVAALVAAAMIFLPPATAEPDERPIAVDTTTLTRGELTEQVRVQGMLGYADQRKLGTQLGGTITALTADGTMIGRGGVLFRVDDTPVVLLHGKLPAWRGFDPAMSNGADVLQLEQNLAALGFFDREPDTDFTDRTTRAVRAWQKSLGLERTGAIELGRIVFATGDVRIESASVKVGASAGAEVLSVTGVTKQVEAFLSAGQRDLGAVGSTATVQLPDGKTAGAKVTAVGAPIEREGANGKSMQIPLTLVLDKPEDAADLAGVSVTVLIAQSRGEDQLLVPVTALLAQPGGGFAVERMPKSGKTKGTPELVTVELGAFADGLVAITGGKLEVGDVVVVAK